MKHVVETLWKLTPQTIQTSPLLNGRREQISLKVIPIHGNELYAAAETRPGLPLGAILATMLDWDEGEAPTFPNVYPDGLHSAERGFAHALTSTDLSELRGKTWTGPRAETLRRRKRKLAHWQQELSGFIAMTLEYVTRTRARAELALEDPDRAGDWAADKEMLAAMIIPPYAIWFGRIRQALEAGQFQDVVNYCDLIKLRLELESQLWFFSRALGLADRSHMPGLMGYLATPASFAARAEKLEQIQDRVGGLAHVLDLPLGHLDQDLQDAAKSINDKAYGFARERLEIALDHYDQLAQMDWR